MNQTKPQEHTESKPRTVIESLDKLLGSENTAIGDIKVVNGVYELVNRDRDYLGALALAANIEQDPYKGLAHAYIGMLMHEDAKARDVSDDNPFYQIAVSYIKGQTEGLQRYQSQQ